MPRIVGVDIPAQRPTRIALTYIFGIGQTTADNMMRELNIDTAVRAKDLTEDEVSRITAYIENNLTVEGHLRRTLAQNITAGCQNIGSCLQVNCEISQVAIIDPDKPDIIKLQDAIEFF